MSETQFEKAWKMAAEDLGFVFISPFQFSGKDSKSFICSGYLPHFGGHKGSLIISGLEDMNPEEADDAVMELGFYVSGLSPKYYRSYDRQLWIDTLCDWGWCGPVDLSPPAWFVDRSNG